MTGSSAGGIGYVSALFADLGHRLPRVVFSRADHGVPRVHHSNAVCQAFAEKGCLVFASARRLEAMENLPESVQRLELDVQSEESCRAAVKSVLDKAGRIDVLGTFVPAARATLADPPRASAQ